MNEIKDENIICSTRFYEGNNVLIYIEHYFRD